MASSAKIPTTAAAVLLVLVFSAAVIATVSVSTLTVFTGPRCAGKTKDVNNCKGVCGCFSISGYQGGFHFVFTEGQKARLYTSYTCKGAYSPLNKETRICSHHDYKTVVMIC